jgi:hypothetical protein
MMGEHLRFIRFDVQREQFNPDKVFQSDATLSNAPVIREIDDQKFQIVWKQYGDFWRDERLTYSAPIQNRCSTPR